jgi:hypothetical protein
MNSWNGAAKGIRGVVFSIPGNEGAKWHSRRQKRLEE